MKVSEVDFKCLGCGACCRIKDGIVRVGDDEVRRIAAFLGMTEQEFIDRETEIAPDRKTLILKSRPDESCVYLTEARQVPHVSVRVDQRRFRRRLPGAELLGGKTTMTVPLQDRR